MGPPPPPGDTSHRLGKQMIVAAWLAALLLLTLLFQGLLERRDNPNRQPDARVGADGTREVNLRRNPAGHYLATGTIDGHPVTFMVDTGATDVAIPMAVAERIGLSGGARGLARTAAGDVETRHTRLDRVTLGPIELTDLRASILDRMEGEEVLLGMSFLGRLELWQRDGVLVLRQH